MKTRKAFAVENPDRNRKALPRFVSLAITEDKDRTQYTYLRVVARVYSTLQHQLVKP